MGRLARFKPGVSITTLLLLAGLLWSLVGSGLLAVGVWFLGPPEHLLLAGLALGLGTVKTRMVLDRVAGRNIKRILAMRDGACVGAVYPLKMWGLVLLMMVLGRLLRASSVPTAYVGALYIGVGWALLWSSRLMWRQWRRSTTSTAS